MKHSII